MGPGSVSGSAAMVAQSASRQTTWPEWGGRASTTRCWVNSTGAPASSSM